MATPAEIAADHRNGCRRAPAMPEHREGRSKYGFLSKEANLERRADAQAIDGLGTLAVRAERVAFAKTVQNSRKTVKNGARKSGIAANFDERRPVKVRGRPKERNANG